MKTEALSFCFLLSASNLISESLFILWAHAAHTVTLPPFLAGSFVIDEGERHEVTVGETSPRR